MAWSGRAESRCTFTDDLAGFEAEPEQEWDCPHGALEDRERCPFHCRSEAIPDDVDVSEAFLDAIAGDPTASREDRKRAKQFIGATFDVLDLSNAVVDAADNHPVDLRGATINRLDCTDSEFGQRLDLRGTTVTGTATFDGTYHEIDARHATIAEAVFTGVTADRVDIRDAQLDTATFERAVLSEIDARDATIGTTTFDRASVTDAGFDRVTIDEGSFQHATLEMADFDEATFGTGDFYHATFDEADFRWADFGTARFYGATFSGGYFNETSYDEAVFERVEAERLYLPDVTLTDATFADAVVSMKLVVHDSVFVGTDFAGADIERLDATDAAVVGAEFADTTVADLQLDGATLASPQFEDSDIDRLRAPDVTCLGTVGLHDCAVGTVDLQPTAVGPDGVAFVSLTETTVEDGVFGQPNAGATVYDLKRTTLGTLRFEGDGTESVLDRVAFYRTRFAGFDFRDDDALDLEGANYCLHELDSALRDGLRAALAYPAALDDAVGALADGTDPAADEPATVVDLAAERARAGALDTDASTTFERLSAAMDGQIDAAAGEVTYLRAKNGANDIADNTAASEFFMSQLAYRRRCHSRRVRDSGASLRERARALARWGMNVFLFVTTGYGERASYTLAASAVLIAAYAGLYLAIAPDLFASVSQYGQLSLGSFIAFFLGGVGEVSDPTVSLLAQSEAFLGAFFVALYVFALTRSVSR
ncbi:pentapeptide repeat-containing protein [Haloarcula argentinensis]|uniref:Pentapeptide repeat-containing protein n=1 Tax=Haloarcula argentinensis TaxID=43776 RepID=A0ABU2F1M6_HALAR|nr:pentapeptide repeat-containing protein [Haloarcula argentinensis]EMA19706.1 pentapeptide repeat-containing protein [Haloarcula argentinensis DSM 12282]MDS0254465.1 pentapeptide repeat-containing protein [Haloarcula argentinensis]